MSNNLLTEISAFVTKYKADLPVTTSEIMAAHEQAESLMIRFVVDGDLEPKAVCDLLHIQAQLAELKDRASRRDEKEQASRRAYTQKESFAIASMERALRDYKEKLSNDPPPIVRERLEACVTVTESKLRDLVEGRISARDAAIRTQELKQELIRLKSRLALNKNADLAVDLGTRIAAIEAELKTTETS